MTDGDTGAPLLYSARCCATSARPRPRSWSRPTGTARSRSSGAGRGPRGVRAPLALVVVGDLRPGPSTSTRSPSTAPSAGRSLIRVPAQRAPDAGTGRAAPAHLAPAGSPKCRPGAPLEFAARTPARPGGRGGHGPDAMVGFALDLTGRRPSSDRPDAADRRPGVRRRPGPATRKLIEQRRTVRTTRLRGRRLGGYCFLCREASTEPSVRWLLSIVPTAMISTATTCATTGTPRPPGAATTGPSHDGRSGSAPPT